MDIPILYKKHLILLKMGAFYQNLLKKHPIYVNWMFAMKTPNCYIKICEKAPQKTGTYMYTMSL